MASETHTAAVRAAFETKDFLRERSLIAFRRTAVGQMVGQLQDARILDIGCGSGELANQFLPANRVTFVDLAGAMLEEAERRLDAASRARARFVRSGLCQFGSGETFDLVLCIGVLAYVQEQREALYCLHRLVRPGGRCILQVTDAGCVGGRLLKAYAACRSRVFPGRVSCSLKWSSYSEIAASAQSAGFAVREERRYWALPPGRRFLGEQFCAAWLDWSWRSRWSHLGSEVLVLLERKVR